MRFSSLANGRISQFMFPKYLIENIKLKYIFKSEKSKKKCSFKRKHYTQCIQLNQTNLENRPHISTESPKEGLNNTVFLAFRE